MQLTFRHHEQLFHELLQLSRSGIPFRKSLEMIARGRSPALSRCALRLQAALNGSDSPAEAFRQAGFAESVVAVIGAAEQTGTLPQNYEHLADYYGRLAQARSRFIRACLYPAVILHLAAFLLPLSRIIQDGGAAYLREVVIFLGGFYVLAAVAFLLWKALELAFRTSPAAAAILRAIPVLGGFLEDLSAWRFSHVLALHLGAGGSPFSGFEAAAQASGNAAIVSAITHALPSVRTGLSLADALKSRARLPEQIERAIEIGEHAGRLDEEARRAAAFYEQKTAVRIDLLTEWIPRLIYIAVLLLVAVRVLQLGMQVMAPMNSLLGE